MSFSLKAPCVRCGHLLNTNDDKITVSFTPDELADLAIDTTDTKVQQRLLCALGLIDPIRELKLRNQLDGV